MEQDNGLGAMGTQQGGPAEEKSSLGPVAAIIIIVILIALGGIYMWKNLQKSPSAEFPAAQNGAASNEAASIQAELNSLDVGADSGLNSLESQLQ